ncbi:MAG: HAMP domain-containing sensor histidine kinase [Parvibaculum sp.]
MTETNQADDAPHAPDGASPSHDSVLAQHVLEEQVRQLFELGKSGSFTVFIAILVLWLPFMPYVAPWTIAPPFLVLVCAQLSFNGLRRDFQEDPFQRLSPTQWGNAYARRTILSGFSWGLAALLWLPDAPFVAQALFCVVVVVLNLQTVVMRHVYPMALHAYFAGSAVPLVLTLLVFGNFEAKIMGGLGGLLWITFGHAARTLHRTNTETVALRYQNDGLLYELAVAKQNAEQKAIDAERAYGTARKAAHSRRDFLSMVTHEIRSPLASLHGLSQLMEKAASSELQKNYAKGLQDSSQFLNRLVDDLADLTEMEALSIKLRPTDMRPVDILKETVQIMRHEATEKGLSMEFDILPGTPALIHNDADRVKQTLINLIGRAIRTTDQGGVVLRLAPVYVGAAEPGVRFSVADTGAGMPTEDANRLFSALEDDEDRGHLRRKDVNLTIADRLVKLMGGRIGADSSVGNGFTAWFILGCNLSDREVMPEPARLAATAGQILDFDHIYELEQDLGTGRISDHLNEVINIITDVQGRIAVACHEGNYEAIRELADVLASQAAGIGLTGLSEAAQHFQREMVQDPTTKILASRSIELDAKLQAGVRALTRAYPSLTN